MPQRYAHWVAILLVACGANGSANGVGSSEVMDGGTDGFAFDIREGVREGAGDGEGEATGPRRGGPAGELVAQVDTAELGSCVAVELSVDGATAPPPSVSLVSDGAALFGDEACDAPIRAIELSPSETKAIFFARPDVAGLVQISAPELGAHTWLTGAEFVDDRADRTLVIYNRNDPAARGIAIYYVQQREIPRDQLCGVRLPVGSSATVDQMLAAKMDVVNDCLCPLTTVRSCGANNLEALESTGITQLALIRGMPSSVTGIVARDDPSFGALFAHSIFLRPSEHSVYVDHQRAVESGGTVEGGFWWNNAPHSKMSDENPGRVRAEDRMLGWSYVQATTPASTIDLIDRTIAAERMGFTGHMMTAATETFENDGNDLLSTRPAIEFVDGYRAGCLDYLRTDSFTVGDAANTWTPELCPLASTGHSAATGTRLGAVPGEPSSVLRPIRAGAYLGTQSRSNGHAAFENFNTMLQWRVTEAPCQPLCADLPVSEQAACRANSKDIFGEINSDCVGVEPGFIGYQHRSYTAQYNGFYPEGWNAQSTGTYVVTVPTQVTGGGYQDARFSDDVYQHFGVAAADRPLRPRCPVGDGTDELCLEPIGMRLNVDIDTAAEAGEDRSVRVRFRYRASADSVDSEVSVIVRSYPSANGSPSFVETVDVPLNAGSTEWQDAEAVFPAVVQDNILRVSFHTTPAHGIRGFLDFDGAEVTDAQTGEHLLDAARGGFGSPTHHDTAFGDWPTNVIDRMGGVFYWGSQSHFRTGGHVTAAPFSGLLRGMTLGEALGAESNRWSAYAQGDPLYRPYASRIGWNIDANVRYFADHHYRAVITESVVDRIALTVSAFLGEQAVDWYVELCEAEDVRECDGVWETVHRGRGRALHQPIELDLASLLDFGREYVVSMRLRTESDETAIASIIQFAVASTPWLECVGDEDGDGYVTRTESNYLDRASGYCTIPELQLHGDIDGDGSPRFTLDDVIAFSSLDPGHPLYDLNGDGSHDIDDERLIVDEYECLLYTADYDLDEDGLLGDADSTKLRGRVGECWWVEDSD